MNSILVESRKPRDFQKSVSSLAHPIVKYMAVVERHLRPWSDLWERAQKVCNT